MKAKCFSCDIAVEAGDADGVVEAFLAHGKEKHSWRAPQQAIRNYARNYAEAAERISSATERLPEIGQVAIHSVTQGRVQDWLHLFDYDAFAGNPDWGSCYCLEPHAPAPPEMPERPWRESRATLAERLRCGATYGYLAYVEGRAVGWVNASLRSEYGLFRLVDREGPPPQTVIGVSCFVIAPPFRRHGIAWSLLDRVIADASARGASWIEGYPHKDPKPNDAAHFRGARSMYDARGFEPIEVRQSDTVMRRAPARN
jgi:GNAT superfamily N-acetyltransferase